MRKSEEKMKKDVVFVITLHKASGNKCSTTSIISFCLHSNLQSFKKAQENENDPFFLK